MMLIEKACRVALSLTVVALLLVSCASNPVAVPQELSFAEIIQRAQEASDRYNYERALFYYNTALERFGSDPASVVYCRYEIAFIYYKQGKDELSAEWFKQVLAMYETATAPLPERFYKLTMAVYPKVEERLKKSQESLNSP